MATTKFDLPIQHLKHFAERHPVQRLAVFGSVLREDFSAASDVDILIEFKPDASIGFFKMYDLEQELTQIIGRQVDLRTPNELSQHFRDAVIGEALLIYESA
jgi:uncharacterized protein